MDWLLDLLFNPAENEIWRATMVAIDARTALKRATARLNAATDLGDPESIANRRREHEEILSVAILLIDRKHRLEYERDLKSLNDPNVSSSYKTEKVS